MGFDPAGPLPERRVPAWTGELTQHLLSAHELLDGGRALAIGRRLQDPLVIALSLYRMGWLGERARDHSTARALHAESADVALAAGNQADAIASFERALYLDADGEVTEAIAYAAASPRAQLISLYSRTSRDLAAVRLAEESGDSDDEQSKRGLLSSAVRKALTSDNAAAGTPAVEVSFQPSMDVARARTKGLRTVAELNDAALARLRVDLVGALVESAARLGQLDRAIALERLRAIEARKPDEKTAIEKRLAELLAAEQARQARSAQVLRVDQQNTSGSIFTARVIGR